MATSAEVIISMATMKTEAPDDGVTGITGMTFLSVRVFVKGRLAVIFLPCHPLAGPSVSVLLPIFSLSFPEGGKQLGRHLLFIAALRQHHGLARGAQPNEGES